MVENIHDRRSKIKEARKSTIRSKGKESTIKLKNDKMEKSKNSKIGKKEINEMSIIKQKKISKVKVRTSKNTLKKTKLSSFKKKDVQRKRNVKEAKKKIRTKQTMKKMAATKKLPNKNIAKKNAKICKKKSSLKNRVTPANFNGLNGMVHINKHKIDKKSNFINMTDENEGLEIMQVRADVHRTETEKDILRYDTKSDETCNKYMNQTNLPKELTNGSFKANKIESLFKENQSEVDKKSYSSLYDNIKRKKRKSSQLALNLLSENKKSIAMKRKLTLL